MLMLRLPTKGAARTVLPAARHVPNADLAAYLDESIPRYLAHAPVSLCLRELNRLVGLRAMEARHGRLHGSILDAGCGDGFWWQFLDRQERRVYGVDISEGEIAQARQVLDQVEICDVSKQAPFEGMKFDGFVGNCSLEHVPDIDGALRNLRRSAASRARLVMFVPTPSWAIQGRTQHFLMSRFPRMGMAFAGALNGFFQHWHIYDHRVWASILVSNGWTVERVYGLGGRRSGFLFRLFLPTGFLAFLVKALTGYYPNRLLRFLPGVLLRPISFLVRRALATPLVEADDEAAYEYMIVAEAREPHEH
jgi:SAM-dependent methyltransferase